MGFINAIDKIGKIITKDIPTLKFTPFESEDSIRIDIKMDKDVIEINDLITDKIFSTFSDTIIPTNDDIGLYFTSKKFKSTMIRSSTNPDNIITVEVNEIYLDGICNFFTLLSSYSKHWKRAQYYQHEPEDYVNPFVFPLNEESVLAIRDNKGYNTAFDSKDVEYIHHLRSMERVIVYFFNSSKSIWFDSTGIGINSATVNIQIKSDNPFFKEVAYCMKIFGETI